MASSFSYYRVICWATPFPQNVSEKDAEPWCHGFSFSSSFPLRNFRLVLIKRLLYFKLEVFAATTTPVFFNIFCRAITHQSAWMQLFLLDLAWISLNFVFIFQVRRQMQYWIPFYLSHDWELWFCKGEREQHSAQLGMDKKHSSCWLKRCFDDKDTISPLSNCLCLSSEEHLLKLRKSMIMELVNVHLPQSYNQASFDDLLI